ncbi:MAG: methyltransferase domain-containing protein [Chloroflexi bacterium]|nr:methyltransferase domain-containing protein [Chloroflexota bacterium]
MIERDVGLPSFWDGAYRSGKTVWDLGEPTPVFRRLLKWRQFAAGRMIVLGAGHGYDAREFARRGFSVVAVDFAAEAVRWMAALADPQASVEIVHASIFDLPHTLDGSFDYVLEYMCYCAIDPARRGDYADLVARLLKVGGRLIDLAFPLTRHDGGPPYAVSVEEIVAQFEPRGLTLMESEWPADSHPARRGREQLLIFQKMP